ncbi:hypothetical protein XELAEV_18009166mg [Xenopus laevis]|uniref:Uncharacterized protein n=1 Tax=Xenopus laevis TaxID=8355 RepID=A0A974I064_XENLA|nr:hypothetical protein XELAEV_18009166mg [Xenopus laevis]
MRLFILLAAARSCGFACHAVYIALTPAGGFLSVRPRYANSQLTAVAHSGSRQQCEEAQKDVKKRHSERSGIPKDIRQEEETLYCLTMPEDFYQFWSFCADIDPETPSVLQRQIHIMEIMLLLFSFILFRDSPEDLPVFVGANEAAKGCLITQLGDHL